MAVVAVAGLALFNVGGKIGGNAGFGRGAESGASRAAAAPAVPTTLTKGMAINALVAALSSMPRPSAEKTLEQMVTGEIPFGGQASKRPRKPC